MHYFEIAARKADVPKCVMDTLGHVVRNKMATILGRLWFCEKAMTLKYCQSQAAIAQEAAKELLAELQPFMSPVFAKETNEVLGMKNDPKSAEAESRPSSVEDPAAGERPLIKSERTPPC